MRLASDLVADLAERSGAHVGSAIGPFMVAFEEELQHFMEVGLVLEPTTLSLITLGVGPEFGARVAAFLGELGLGEKPERIIGELQRDLDPSMLVRVAADPEDRPEVDLYFRRARSIEETVAWLRSQGVNQAEQKALRDLGLLAATNQTGIFGASFRKDEPPLYKAYVHIRADSTRSLADRLHPLFEHFRIPGQGWQAMLDGLDPLSRCGEADAFVSLLLGDGDAFDSLKLDLFHVDLEVFTALCRTSGLLSRSAPSPIALGEALSLTCAEHCGFRFDDEGGVRLTVYLGSDS